MSTKHVFLDRYRIQIQNRRQRGERSLVDLNWNRIVDQVKDMKGVSYKIRNGRCFAVVKAFKNTTNAVPYLLLEGGIYTPGKVPDQWKPGDDEVKKVQLAGNHEWIYQAFFAFPLVGNQIIIHSTRNGPHIGDITWWIKKTTGCNYVSFDFVPTDSFDNAFKAHSKYNKVVMTLRKKPRSPSHQMRHLESKLGSEAGAGKIIISYIPDEKKSFTKSVVRGLVGKYIPTIPGNIVNSNEPYQIEECELIPTDEDGSPSDVLRYLKGTRRTAEVTLLPGGSVSKDSITTAMADELNDWLG